MVTCGVVGVTTGCGAKQIAQRPLREQCSDLEHSGLHGGELLGCWIFTISRHSGERCGCPVYAVTSLPDCDDVLLTNMSHTEDLLRRCEFGRPALNCYNRWTPWGVHQARSVVASGALHEVADVFWTIGRERGTPAGWFETKQ